MLAVFQLAGSNAPPLTVASSSATSSCSLSTLNQGCTLPAIIATEDGSNNFLEKWNLQAKNLH